MLGYVVSWQGEPSTAVGSVGEDAAVGTDRDQPIGFPIYRSTAVAVVAGEVPGVASSLDEIADAGDRAGRQRNAVLDDATELDEVGTHERRYLRGLLVGVDYEDGVLAGATIGFALCLVNSITVACVLALADEVDAVTSMRALVRQGVAFACLVAFTALAVWTTTAAVVGGIAADWLANHFLVGRVATAGGLAAGFAVAIVVAAVIGLTGCWVNALGPGRGYGWVRYLLGVKSAARRGLLPGRPALFIDWCVRTGLMRRCGTRFQFRHPDLAALVGDRYSERPAADRAPAPAQPSLAT